MNRITDHIRAQMLRKQFSWMDHAYQFLLLGENYQYDTTHTTVDSLPSAYVLGRTGLFNPTDDTNGVAASQGVPVVSVANGEVVGQLALCTADSDGDWSTDDDVTNEVIAIIDDGYDLPFVAEGNDIYILPHSIITNAWFTV